MTAARNDILQGWKDIAAYVSRDVRTVKRWETQRGLPVRRMPGEGRANVYALISEIDAWLASGSTAEAEAAEEAPVVVSAPVTTEASVPAVSASTEKRSLALRHRWRIAALIAISAGAITAVALGVRAHLRSEHETGDVPPFSATQTARSVKYSSKVAGVDALYLRGIYFYEQRTPDTLEHALKYFNDAIARDPNYAPAYAGLAQAYNLIRQYSTMPEDEAYTRAETAAKHAVQLDPNLSEAHASLGFIDFFWHWDARKAEEEFHRAIALDPNSGLAHHWYGSMLTHQGRFAESLRELDEAQRLQPTSISVLSDRAFSLGMGGHRNEAADLLQEVLSEEPKSPAPHYILASISLVEPRDIPRYLDERRRYATLRHDPVTLEDVDAMSAAYQKSGETGMWRARLDLEMRRHPAADDPTYARATMRVTLGQKEAGLRDLELLAQRRDGQLPGIAIDPLLAPIRHEPRYEAIVARLASTPVH